MSFNDLLISNLDADCKQTINRNLVSNDKSEIPIINEKSVALCGTQMVDSWMDDLMDRLSMQHVDGWMCGWMDGWTDKCFFMHIKNQNIKWPNIG